MQKLGLVLVIGITLVLGFFLGKRNPNAVVSSTDTVTVTKYDTVLIDNPIIKYKYLDRIIHDTLVTITSDTVIAQVPIEKLVYEEDSLYKVEVSGYKVNVDNITVYPKTITNTITNTVIEKSSPWGFAVGTGPGMVLTPSGNIYGGWTINVGITYKF